MKPVVAISSLAAMAFLLLQAAPPLAAQGALPSSSTWELSLNGSYMMTNNSRYSSNNSVAYGIEAAWLHRSFADDYWRVRRRHPSFGIRASYARIPDNIAGDRYGLVGLLRRPLSDRFHYTIGFGLSAYTKPFSRMMRAMKEGRTDEALRLHYAMLNMNQLIFADGNPAGIKCLMSHIGLCENVLRLPLVTVNERVEADIVEEWKRLKSL